MLARPGSAPWSHPEDGFGRHAKVVGGVEPEQRRAFSRFGSMAPRTRNSIALRRARNDGAAKTRRAGLRQRVGDAYSEIDVIFLQQVARQVAVALDNALNFEQVQSVQQQLTEERDRLRLLLEVNNTVVSVLDLHQLLNAVSASLRQSGAARICEPLAL